MPSASPSKPTNAAHRLRPQARQLFRHRPANAPKPSRTKHVVDIKLSLPGFGGRTYFRLIAGPERRSAARLRREGQLKPWKIAIFWAVALFVFFAAILFASALFFFITGSVTGWHPHSGRPPMEFMLTK